MVYALVGLRLTVAVDVAGTLAANQGFVRCGRSTAEASTRSCMAFVCLLAPSYDADM